MGFKFTLFSNRCIFIGLNFWWLPSRHKFDPKRLGTQTFQLHFHFLSGVHNICACAVFVLTNLLVWFKTCANLPWWIVTLVHKMCLKVKGWILNIAQCLCWLIYLCVSKLVLAFLGELWTCFTKCAFNWKGEFWNTYAFRIRLGALESWFLIKNSGVADVTVHLALSKLICDRQIVI